MSGRGVNGSAQTNSFWRVAALAICVLAITPLFTLLADVSAQARSCSGVRGMGGGLSVVDVPDDLGGSGIRYAVDPARPKRIYVSGRGIVKRSPDGGCTWKQVFPTSSLDQEPFDSACLSAGTVRSVHVVRGARATGSITYVQVENSVARRSGLSLGLSCIYRSNDQGATWEQLGNLASTDGVGPMLGVGDLLPSPTKPRTIYAFRDSLALLWAQIWTYGPPAPWSDAIPDHPFVGPSYVYSSGNGGKDWDQHALPGASGGIPSLCEPGSSVDTHPARDKEVWGAFYSSAGLDESRSGLYHSADRGRTWTFVQTDPSPLASNGEKRFINYLGNLDVFRTPAGHTGLLFTMEHNSWGQSPTRAIVRMSMNGGRTWRELPPQVRSPRSCIRANDAGTHALVVSITGEWPGLYNLGRRTHSPLNNRNLETELRGENISGPPQPT